MIKIFDYFFDLQEKEDAPDLDLDPIEIASEQDEDVASEPDSHDDHNVVRFEVGVDAQDESSVDWSSEDASSSEPSILAENEDFLSASHGEEEEDEDSDVTSDHDSVSTRTASPRSDQHRSASDHDSVSTRTASPRSDQHRSASDHDSVSTRTTSPRSNRNLQSFGSR
jgi:hypothetical protein